MSLSLSDPCAEALIRGGPLAQSCTKSIERWVLAATILGSSMAFIDGTVVNVALPALQTSLNAEVADVQWVIEAYSLFLAALLLVGGSLGDRFGRRRVFVIGVAIFAGASAWCGFAPDIRHLIIARAIQGIGAALLVPGSLAIISSSFREEERGPRHWHVVRVQRDDRRDRAGARRLAGGPGLVARCLLHQHPARDRCHRDLALARAGK